MKKMLSALGLLLLTSCMPAAIGGGLGTTVAAPVIASSLGVSVTTLSEVAKAACAAQSAANIGEIIALRRGRTDWAQHFAEISRVTGVGCIW